MRRQGKVTVKYDRKELRKRLNLEEWILEQLTRLYDCQVCLPPCTDTLKPVPIRASWKPHLEPACHPESVGTHLKRAPLLSVLPAPDVCSFLSNLSHFFLIRCLGQETWGWGRRVTYRLLA